MLAYFYRDPAMMSERDRDLCGWQAQEIIDEALHPDWTPKERWLARLSPKPPSE